MKRFFPVLLILIIFLTACSGPAVSPAEPTEPVREMPVTLAPVAWDGIDPARDVYVSRNCIVHDSPICSGMENYKKMTAAEAYEEGYRRCRVCW